MKNNRSEPKFSAATARKSRVSLHGFTLIELLIVVAIVAILAALLLPALQKAKDRAKTAKCASNLHQLAVAMNIYTDDYNGTLMTTHPRCPSAYCPGSTISNPYLTSFLGTLYDLNYCRNYEVMNCPSDLIRLKLPYHAAYTFGPPPDYSSTSYGYNYAGLGLYGDVTSPPDGWGPFHKAAEVKNPALTYWVADNSDYAHISGSLLYGYGNTYDEIPTWRHSNGMNMLWIDGHVSWISSEEMRRHYPYVGGPEYWHDLN